MTAICFEADPARRVELNPCAPLPECCGGMRSDCANAMTNAPAGITAIASPFAAGRRGRRVSEIVSE
jgi:hypothetical protein